MAASDAPSIQRPSWADRLTGWLRCALSAASPLDMLRADGPVAFSGAAVAARRALETAQRRPIAVDPLAAALAGKAAVAAAKKRAKARTAVSAMAIRTRWFDDEIMGAGLEAGDARAVVVGVSVVGGGRVAVSLAPPPASPSAPRQVVNVGAGSDARPWRLPLPPGTAWWEVDAATVLTVKAVLLTRARAGGVPRHYVTADGCVPLPSPRRVRAQLHPLRASSLAFVAADVGERGWGRALAVAGHDAARPTLFVLEGVIMYMAGDRGAATLLTEAASIAAPGSVLLVVSVTAATAAAARRSASPLRAAWTFGSDPAHPDRLLAACGWRVRGIDTRGDMVRRYAGAIGGRPLEFGVGRAGARSARESVFMVAERV